MKQSCYLLGAVFIIVPSFDVAEIEFSAGEIGSQTDVERDFRVVVMIRQIHVLSFSIRNRECLLRVEKDTVEFWTGMNKRIYQVDPINVAIKYSIASPKRWTTNKAGSPKVSKIL